MLRIGVLIVSVPDTGGLQGAVEGIAIGVACAYGARGLLGVGSAIESAEVVDDDDVGVGCVLYREKASAAPAL